MFCLLKIIDDFLVLQYNCLFTVPPIITWGQQGRNKIPASFIFYPDNKPLFKDFSVTINPTQDLFGPTLLATAKQFAGVSWTLASVLVTLILWKYPSTTSEVRAVRFYPWNNSVERV